LERGSIDLLLSFFLKAAESLIHGSELVSLFFSPTIDAGTLIRLLFDIRQLTMGAIDQHGKILVKMGRSPH